jgi:hypothetical protein
MLSLRSPAEIVGRLELPAAAQILLIDAPEELEAIFAAAAGAEQSIQSATARRIRSVRDAYDFILLWQESRIGSRAALEGAVKRLAPGGRLWVVTAMKKVMGPRTPATHRLELEDLRKAFARDAMVCDREARLSAWHIAYRFVRKPPGKID